MSRYPGSKIVAESYRAGERFDNLTSRIQERLTVSRAEFRYFPIRDRPVVGAEAGQSERPTSLGTPVNEADSPGVPGGKEAPGVGGIGLGITDNTIDPEAQGLALTAAGEVMPLAVEHARRPTRALRSRRTRPPPTRCGRPLHSSLCAAPRMPPPGERSASRLRPDRNPGARRRA